MRQSFALKMIQAAERACCLRKAGGRPFHFALIPLKTQIGASIIEARSPAIITALRPSPKNGEHLRTAEEKILKRTNALKVLSMDRR
jgi:hypothetical protein